MNPFLQDFMRRQTNIIQSAAPQSEAAAEPGARKKKSKHGTKDGKAPFGEQDALQRIITEKPPKKQVLQYFKDRIAELVAADMS
jgi:hypothetical protein